MTELQQHSEVEPIGGIVRMRKMDPGDREQAETVLELYMQAMGML